MFQSIVQQASRPYATKFTLTERYTLRSLSRRFIETSYREGGDLVLLLTRLEDSCIRLREVNESSSEPQVLEQFVTSLPIWYNSAVDSLAIGLGVHITRAHVVSYVPPMYARLNRNAVSLITNDKNNSKGKTSRKPNIKRVRCYHCRGEGQYPSECLSKGCRGCSSRGHGAKTCPSASAPALARAPALGPATAANC